VTVAQMKWLARVAVIVGVMGVIPGLQAYVTTGRSWAGNVVTYYVNTSNSHVSGSALVSAVQQAAAVWSQQTLANIQLSYAGTTSGSSLTLNYRNEVFLRNQSSSAVASTYWWSDGTGRILDFDTALYGGSTQFYAGSGCTGGVYVENVMVHEFGHGLGLAHTSVGGATMYPSMSGYCDRTQLTLEADDIAGIESIYPSGSTSQKPTAPTSLAAATAGTANLTLTWTDRSSNESGFYVERSLNGNSFSRIAQLSANATSYNNGLLTAGTLYYYRVQAFNGAGVSAYTNTASARTATTTTTTTTTTASPDGTTVPTATQIVDSQGAVWTIGGGGKILRNGVHAAGGYGAKILWSGGVIYVQGTDGRWWRWTGSGWYSTSSPTSTTSTTSAATTTTTASPDGTTVPTATQIVDSQGAVWTIGSGGKILRNGVHAAGGYGAKILWSGGVIYVQGTDGRWWRWTGSAWNSTSSPTTTTSVSGASADGTRVPTAAQIVDSQGAIWTIGSGGKILRNGLHAAYGYGSQILWSGGVIYVLGTNGSTWYRWTGTGWVGA
jgi:hypothetical protein